MKQLIYRQVREEPFEIVPLEGCRFFFAEKAIRLLAVPMPVVKCFGIAGAVKTFVKLLSGKRCLYGVVSGGQLVHHAWVSLGFCQFYDVGGGDCVVGPIWSHASSRGKGVATWALKQAINKLIERGRDVFYIDTSEDNVPCIKVAEHCGFGPAVRTYDRRSADKPGEIG